MERQILVLCQILFMIEVSEEFLDISKVDIQQHVGVIDGHVTLPCNTIGPRDDDTMQLVLWFRNGSKAPFYTYDARRRSPGEGQHTVDDLRSPRADLQYLPLPGSLVLKGLRFADRGLYICRAEFLQSPAQTVVSRLSIIVPPDTPKIYDTAGHQLKTFTPRVQEKQTLTLLCVVEGGDPSPNITWTWSDKSLEAHQTPSTSSSTTSQTSGNVQSSRLTISAPKRSSHLSLLTCNARNTNLTQSRRSSLRLQMRLPPLALKIRSVPSHLTAGKSQQMLCEASGSVPSARITWLQNATRQIISTRNLPSSDPNVTVSELTLRPEVTEKQVKITCLAENPHILLSKPLYRTQLLYVHFAPILNVQLGKQLDVDSIIEGSDVYFQCSVQASPPITLLYWSHQGERIVASRTAGVTITGRTLVLNGVRRNQAGRYKCHAANVEGHSNSDHFTLRVMYSPQCADKDTPVIFFLPGRPISIKCRLQADPAEIRFRWEMSAPNSTGSAMSLTSYTTEGLTSILSQHVVEEHEREIVCWGSNSVGRQTTPCVFHLKPAEHPERPVDCHTFNASVNSFEVTCQPPDMPEAIGPITFTLEVIKLENNQSLFNITREQARFIVDKLEPGTNYTLLVRGTNARGWGSPAQLLVATHDLIPDRIAYITASSTRSVVMATGSAALLFITVTVVMVVSVRRRHSRQDHIPNRNGSRRVQSNGDHQEMSPRLTSDINLAETMSTIPSSRPTSASDELMLSLAQSKHHRNCSKSKYRNDSMPVCALHSCEQDYDFGPSLHICTCMSSLRMDGSIAGLGIDSEPAGLGPERATAKLTRCRACRSPSSSKHCACKNIPDLS